MGSTYILFEMPEWIAEGLQNGTLTRGITGVIREVSNGQIVYHLKEVAQMVDPEKIMENLQAVGKQLAGIQQMQALQLAGIAGVGAVCIAGFIFVGVQLHKIKKQLNDIRSSLDEIKKSLNSLHYENVIKLSEPYFQAMAAYMDGDYEDGYRLAQACSGAIHNYFIHIPINEIMANENELTFLMKTLNSAMQCQLACAQKCNRKNIPEIVLRYRELFIFINNIIGNECNRIMKCIPDSCSHKIMLALKNKNGFLCNTRKALPIAIEMLENEQRFIELVRDIEPAQLEAAITGGAKYIGVAEASN